MVFCAYVHKEKSFVILIRQFSGPKNLEICGKSVLDFMINMVSIFTDGYTHCNGLVYYARE
jgi:hypothetical protein